MDQKTAHHESTVTMSIARQPIFDAKRRLWGYSLYAVGGDSLQLSPQSGTDSLAANVAASAYIALEQIVSRGKKIIVNFSEKNLLDNLPYALPPILAAVKVPEQLCEANPALLDALKRLKADGYLIVIEGFTTRPHGESAYRLADIISINASGRSKDQLSAIITMISEYPAHRLARNIENPERFALCQQLGFTLFHGPFFKSPQNFNVRKLSSNEISRFNILKVIEQEEPDMAKLAELIQADVSISFRLLAYLNSAAFGLRQNISSIHQAIPLLGWQKMKNWLRVILLTDMNQSGEVSELFLLSAQRGKFLELLARDHDFWGFNPDSLLLLGMFSLLDTMLGMPMNEVIRYIPIDNKLEAALCREPNNEYLPFLQLATCLEEAQWDEAETIIQRLGLNGGKVRAAFQQAVDWAGTLSPLGAKPSAENQDK